MRLMVEKTARLSGAVTAPPSKSHSHRAIAIASLATGESIVNSPLICDDTLATIAACRAFGAKIDGSNGLVITGVGGKPARSDSDLNVNNSGTTMRFMAAIYALCKGATTLTGGDSVCARPMGPLLTSLGHLGAPRARSLGGEGRPPVCIIGRMTGGSTTLDGESSQYLSALLLACPLAANDSMIAVKELRSAPYASMTLEHIRRAGAGIWTKDMSNFFIPGGQQYKTTNYVVPGDWSSAAFLHAAAIVTGSDITVEGLGSEDVQGDRIFPELGRKIISGDSAVELTNNPDLLPALAVVACHSSGTTILNDASHARRKESDRISAICSELKKMGAAIEEMPDGLKIHGSKLHGAELDGHGDHRIVMALAIAGLAAEGKTVINGGDAISKSYPGFVSDLAGLGAKIRMVE